MCRLHVPRFAARVSGGGQVRDAGRAVELGLHVARDAAAIVFVAPREVSAILRRHEASLRGRGPS